MLHSLGCLPTATLGWPIGVVPPLLHEAFAPSDQCSEMVEAESYWPCLSLAPNGRHSSGYSLSVWALDCRILTCSHRIESLFCPYPSKPFIYVLPQVSLKCCYNICLNYLLLQLAPCTHHPLCLEKVAPLVPNKPHSYPSFPP